MAQMQRNLVGRNLSPCLLPTQILEPKERWCRFRARGGRRIQLSVDSLICVLLLQSHHPRRVNDAVFRSQVPSRFLLAYP